MGPEQVARAWFDAWERRAVFRCENGKIVSQREYYDLLTMVRQLGWLPLFAGAPLSRSHGVIGR
jgi:hypothetical protein